LARAAVEFAGDEGASLALESEGKLRILHAEENKTAGGGESAIRMPIVENERNFSEGGMLDNERCVGFGTRRRYDVLRSHWF
jgi:hypothetical protein